MRKISFLLFFLSTCTFINATIVKGKILDSNSNVAVEFVNVSFVDVKTKKMVAGTVTDASGMFAAELPIGKFVLKASFVGYKTKEQAFELKSLSKTFDFGVISMEEEAALLNEVEVVAQGSQMRLEIDKKVFNVDQNLSAAGASVSEVLRDIPSVDVDGEGNISLRNNTNVEVWINGKPAGLTEENRAQILEQMPAGSIESVELITNPSAKYSPEGTAGVINLVMKKKDTKTYFGSVSTGIQWPTGGLPGGNVGASFNYTSSKLDFYFNVGLDCRNMIRGGESNRYALDNAVDTLSLLTTVSNGKSNRAGIFSRAGIDVHIDSRNTIGLSGFGMYNNAKSATDITYSSYNYRLQEHPLLRNYSRDNEGKDTHPIYKLNLAYKHDFMKKGSFLSADVSFASHERSSKINYMQNEIYVDSTYLSGNEVQSSVNKNINIDGNVDFCYKFTDKRRLEAGWESKFGNRKNNAFAYDNLIDAEIAGFYNNFDYKEQIHSLYATYGDMYGNFSMMLGLRAEYMKVNTQSQTKTENINNERTYFQLFPSVFLAYNFPGNNELQLNYTRRVNRPRGRQINPYRDFSDSLNVFYGNPYLYPQFANSLELNYLKTWNNHSISASAYYKYVDNVIQRVGFRNGNVLESTFFNVSKQQSSGFEFVAKNRLFKILSLTTSINLYYEKMDSVNFVTPYGNIVKINACEDFSWNIRLMAGIMITKTTSAQITGNYRAPRIIAQGRQNHDYSLDIGLRQTFFDGRLNLSFTARDILDSRRFRSETWSDNFYQKSENYRSGRTIGFVVSYNFGNFSSKKRQKNTNGDKQSDTTDMEIDDFGF